MLLARKPVPCAGSAAGPRRRCPADGCSASTCTSIRQGLLSLIGVLQRALEVLRLGDREALDARGARPGGEVRVVGLAGPGPGRSRCRISRPSKYAYCRSRIAAQREVVPHHPDRRDVVLDRGAQHVRHHGEAAVAADRHARPVGRGELGAEDRARAEAHAGKAPGVEHRLRPARLPELHEPVVVDAGVERDDRVVGQHRAAVGDDALGPDRRGVDVEVGPDEGLPLARASRRSRRATRGTGSRRRGAASRARRAAGAGTCARRRGCRGRARSCGRSRRGRRRRGSAWLSGSSTNSPASRTTTSGRRSARRSPITRSAWRPAWLAG